MATTLSDVSDLFMSKVSDYRLVAIYQTSGSTALSSFIEPWLLNSVVEFDVCTPPLNYIPTSGSIEGSFSEDLTLENKMILAELIVKNWLQKSIQDVLQMNNAIQDHDFKTFAQSSNLKAKQDYYNTVRENVSQLLVDYGYRHNDWSGWKSQEWNF